MVTSKYQAKFLFNLLDKNLGDDVKKDTGMKSKDFNAAIVGFWTSGGDIDELGANHIITMYMYKKEGTWWIRSDFITHEDNNENWGVDVMFVRKELSSIDSY